MKKYSTILVRTLLIIVAIALIAYLGIYVYVTRNKASILKQVTTEIGEKINGNVAIGDMDLNFFSAIS